MSRVTVDAQAGYAATLSEDPFVVYVNHENWYCCGYAAVDGSCTPWRRDARKFASIESANAFIAARGWEPSTSVIPGRTSAYVAHRLDH